MTVHPLLPMWAWCVLTAVLVVGAARSWRSRRAVDTPSVARRIAMGATLLLLALHPGVGSAAASRAQSDLDVLVVVDRTTSMAALDWDGQQQRLVGVRSDLAATAETLAGSRFALLTFGRSAHLDLPFSSDTATFTAAAAGIRAEDPFDGTGSSPDRPLAAIGDLLARDRDQHPDRRRILLYLGDGEVTESKAGLASFDPLRSLVDGGLVIGYGTEAGGRMRVFADPAGGSTYLTLPSGADALSRIDEGNLRAMAEQVGIGYVHSVRPGGVISQVEAISRSYAAGPGSGPARHDLSWLLGLLLLAFALVEARSILADLRAARRARGAVGRAWAGIRRATDCSSAASPSPSCCSGSPARSPSWRRRPTPASSPTGQASSVRPATPSPATAASTSWRAGWHPSTPATPGTGTATSRARSRTSRSPSTPCRMHRNAPSGSTSRWPTSGSATWRPSGATRQVRARHTRPVGWRSPTVGVPATPARETPRPGPPSSWTMR